MKKNYSLIAYMIVCTAAVSMPCLSAAQPTTSAPKPLAIVVNISAMTEEPSAAALKLAMAKDKHRHSDFLAQARIQRRAEKKASIQGTSKSKSLPEKQRGLTYYSSQLVDLVCRKGKKNVGARL